MSDRKSGADGGKGGATNTKTGRNSKPQAQAQKGIEKAHSRFSILQRAMQTNAYANFAQSLTKQKNEPFRGASILQPRPMIAFVPENEDVPQEMLELEVSLEAEHHRHSLEYDKKRESLNDTNLEREPSLIIPSYVQIQIARTSNASVASSKSHVGAKNMTPSAYGFLPRPFTEHLKDIEKRRARKFIEIMNSSNEDFTFSEKDRRVKFAPSGALIFHVLELYNLEVNKNTFISALPVTFYCILSIGSVKRCSKVVHSLTAKRIRVDYSANFSIEVSEWRESPFNRFNVELWSYQDPEIHYIVGSMEMHVYEFIRKQHAIEIMQLWSDGIKVGRIAFEYAFSYGTFGYGHSNHLLNPKNPIMETVCHSMYPRIRLEGKDLCDKVYKVRLPEQLKLFTYNSLILETGDAMEAEIRGKKKKAHKPIPQDYESKPTVVQQVTFEEDKPAHCKLHMNIWQKEIQADFNDAYGEYVCYGTRRTRLDYLSNLIQGRMRDIRETELTTLFRPLREREAEKVYKSEVSFPGYIVYPQKISCPASLGQPKLSPDDVKFQDEFPTTRRVSGYLSTLFGFDKKAEPSEFLNDMEVPLYKEAGKRKKQKLKRCFACIRRFFLRIGAYFNLCYNFVFPEIHKPPKIPEVSLTTPTPEGSTTNLFTYYVRDQKEIGLNKVEKLQAQTTALIEIAEKPLDGGFDDETFSESSSEGEGNVFRTSAKTKQTRRRTNASFNANTRFKMPKRSEFGFGETIQTQKSKKKIRPIGSKFTGPGGHFKTGINQALYPTDVPPPEKGEHKDDKEKYIVPTAAPRYLDYAKDKDKDKTAKPDTSTKDKPRPTLAPMKPPTPNKPPGSAKK